MTEKRTMLAVQVTTFNGDNEETTRQIDFNSRESTEWLRKHMIWAFLNGRVIELINVKDLVE